MNHLIKCSLKKMVLAAALAVIPAMAPASDSHVVMLTKEGTTYELALTDVDRIDFGETSVELRGKAGENHAVAYADVDRILIGVQSSVADLTSRGDIAVFPSVTAGPLSIAGVLPGTEVAVFDASGRCLSRSKAEAETMSLDLSGAPAGIVIVRIGEHSVKIIKK